MENQNVDQDLRIPRPEVDIGKDNEAYAGDLPAPDYEVDNGLTDIDIMMADEFKEIELESSWN